VKTFGPLETYYPTMMSAAPIIWVVSPFYSCPSNPVCKVYACFWFWCTGHCAQGNPVWPCARRRSLVWATQPFGVWPPYASSGWHLLISGQRAQ